MFNSNDLVHTTDRGVHGANVFYNTRPSLAFRTHEFIVVRTELWDLIDYEIR